MSHVLWTLLLRLAGPLQSWGGVNYTARTSGTKPTRPGVIGLLAGALGKRKGENLSDLNALEIGVRVDAPGVLERDFIIARGVLAANLARTHERSRTERYHLADATFLVGLSGDPALLKNLDAALRAPRFLPYLGRREYPPGHPIWLNDGIKADALIAALTNYPPLVDEPLDPPYICRI